MYDVNPLGLVKEVAAPITGKPIPMLKALVANQAANQTAFVEQFCRCSESRQVTQYGAVHMEPETKEKRCWDKEGDVCEHTIPYKW